jgi:hypothetical protein
MAQPPPARHTRIDSEFVVEGTKGTMVVWRVWKPDAKLEEADTVVSARGSKTSDLETMGWAGAVEMYRPFLSYSELGSMLDAGPSALYDALSAILGLEPAYGPGTTRRRLKHRCRRTPGRRVRPSRDGGRSRRGRARRTRR